MRVIHALSLSLAGALLVVCGCASAVTQEQVIAGAAQLYAQRIAALDQARRLDTDADFVARVARVARGLIQQAVNDYPGTADWLWELHTTNDPEQNADCMAGGKILVSQDYVERLELNDAELAMLLAHEIAHATLRHNLKEYEQVERLDPTWLKRPFEELEDAVDNDDVLVEQLAPLDFAQEVEADRAGLLLAWRAGWPAERLAGYFKKMMRVSGAPNFDTATHPAPASRWHAAHALAATLDAQQRP